MSLLLFAAFWFALGINGVIIFILRNRGVILPSGRNEVILPIALGIILGPIALYSTLTEKNDEYL